MDRFTEIDKETWPRKELFALFSKPWMATNITANKRLRAEKLVKLQKARGKKLVPALLYIFSKELSRDPAFTVANKDGVLGYWDKIHPMYAVLNDNGTFTFHLTPLEDDFSRFYDAYMREKEENAGKLGAYASDMPFNCYSISVMNYFPFDSFSVSMANNKYSFMPYVFMGQYDKKYLLPVSVTMNHAVCDGYHLSELFRRLQAAFDSPEEYLYGG